MSSYTMQLKEYIEMWTQNNTTISTRERIETGRTKLFDFTYPIFDENYRKVFETHFIRNFYTREIGFETEGLFKFHLETWLSINMPYFNKLFESELLDFDPLVNSMTEMKYKKQNDKSMTQTSKGDSSSNGSGSVAETGGQNQFTRQLESNTPDSRLAITTEDGKGVIEYASHINEETDTNTKTSSTTQASASSGTVNSSSDGVINDVEDYVQYRAGKIGVQSFSKMVNEYRESFIRIENKIFNEMNQLFMLVY